MKVINDMKAIKRNETYINKVLEWTKLESKSKAWSKYLMKELECKQNIKEKVKSKLGQEM